MYARGRDRERNTQRITDFCAEECDFFHSTNDIPKQKFDNTKPTTQFKMELKNLKKKRIEKWTEDMDRWFS